MGRDEPDQDGNLEIEVSPLQPSVRSEDTTGEWATFRPLFAPVRARQVQVRRSIVIMGILSLVLVALVVSLAPTRDALRGVIFGPTPTATAPVPAGEDDIYIALSPRWGAVSLDNHTVTPLPTEGRDLPLRLARGRHVLRWRFAPIIDYSCQLTVPLAEGDSCPTRLGIQPGKKGIAHVVTMQLSLKILSPTYRTTLLAAMQAALDAQVSSDTVLPGEHYMNLAQSGFPQVASQPLRATLRFVLDAENPQAQCAALQSSMGDNCTMNGDCRELCTAPWQSQSDTSSARWRAYIVAHASWHITTLAGQVVADNQPDTGSYLQFLGHDEHPIPITIGWDGSQWSVSAALDGSEPGSPFSAPACLSAQDEVAFQEILPPEIPDATGAIWIYIPGEPIASGCLAAAVPLDLKGVPDTSARGLANAGLILHRFGVDLAANAAAHRYWPDMPVADAYELPIAQALAQKLPAVVAAAVAAVVAAGQ